MDDDDDLDLAKVYPRPKLIHRMTQHYEGGPVRETSLYRLPHDQGFWLDQLITVGTWVVRHRLAFDARVAREFLPFLKEIAENEIDSEG